MTGTYHKPVYRAMKKAGFETRLVHPFASSHYRLAQHGDLKTDDNDLAGIFRAAVNGFGLIQKEVPAIYSELQILSRHRRDLVKKKSKLQSQIRHHLQQCLPGFCDLFEGDALWKQTTPIPLLKALAPRGGTAHELVQAGFEGVCQWLNDAGIRFRKPAVERVILWAADAASPDAMAPIHTLVWQSLIDDWTGKQSQISQLEIKIANVLVQTPYILLLSHPGINVVSAGELAGEMGPIENYASSKAISGRAGLFPSRYQSDGVDRGGPLSRFRNARLRAAWMIVADNMIKCNQYWQLKSAHWKAQGHDPRDIRCRIANRMTRVVFQMISGKKLFSHPSQLSRGYVLEKLMVFLKGHQVPPHLIVRDLALAAKQIPPSARADEAKPLQQAHEKSQRSRRANPQSLGSLLVAVLANLGIGGEDDNPVES
jgi:transposase